MDEINKISPGARGSRRPSFSRRSLPQSENTNSAVQSDRSSFSDVIKVIFHGASEAISRVGQELHLTQNEMLDLKAKLESFEEVLGSRDGPVENAIRCRIAVQEGYCPPKRVKTDFADDLYIRSLQQTLDGWTELDIRNTLSELTFLEPLPTLQEVNEESLISTEDILETQQESLCKLLAAEALFEANNLRKSSEFVNSFLRSNT